MGRRAVINDTNRGEVNRRILSGETDEQIAEWLNCHPRTVANYRKRLLNGDAPPPPPKPPPPPPGDTANDDDKGHSSGDDDDDPEVVIPSLQTLLDNCLLDIERVQSAEVTDSVELGRFARALASIQGVLTERANSDSPGGDGVWLGLAGAVLVGGIAADHVVVVTSTNDIPKEAWGDMGVPTDDDSQPGDEPGDDTEGDDDG